MADTKETKNAGINFPCGNVEEMLRMMRQCREKGNIDCEKMMKHFMGKEGRNIDFKEMKKQLFAGDSKSFNFEEIMKKCCKR